jgi:hypothetical protein
MVRASGSLVVERSAVDRLDPLNCGHVRAGVS